MKRITTLLAASAIAMISSGCVVVGDDDGGADGTSGSADGTGDDSADGGTMQMTTSPEPTTVTATADETGTDDDAQTGDTGPAGGFEFSDIPPEDMTQVDRLGMPAINTAVITSKDDYNAATPADDANADFVPEIQANLEGLHAALDDDLMDAGLLPCVVADCVTQAAPLVVPDVISINPGADAGFPNGRLPADPVIDVTLAVVLLDLGAEGQDAATLAGLPLNPPANDVPFLTEFPFLAEPN